MFNTKKAIKFWVVLVVFIFSLGCQQVYAIEYGMLGGKPANPDPNVSNSSSWFIYNLNSGEAKDDALLVMNMFDQPNEVLVYAADTTPSSSGGFALKQFSEPKDEVGSWVKFYPDLPPQFFQELFEKKESRVSEFCRLSREDIQKEFGKKTVVGDTQFQDLEQWCQGKDSVNITLKAKEKLVIPFVISIPVDVDAGEHTGGILIQKVTPEDANAGNGSSVKLTTRVGVRIYETVPGEIIRKISLENFQVIKNFKEFDFSGWFSKEKKSEEYLVQSSVRNSGNVSVENINTVHVKDLLFNKRTEDVPRTFQALKGDVFVSNYSWNNPRFGHFSFQTEVVYKDANGQEQTLTSDVVKIWIMPWREMAAVFVLLILVAAAYFAFTYYQKKKYGGIGWVKCKVKKNDTVAKLADKYELDWKVLVKTNKLKAPYLLKAGQIILVPSSGEKEKIGSNDFYEKKQDNVGGEKKIIEEKEAAAERKNKELPVEEAPKKKVASGKKPKNMDVIARIAKGRNSRPKAVLEEKFLVNNVLWIIIGSILLIAALVMAVFLYRQSREIEVLNEKISITSAGVSVPQSAEPEESAELKKEEIVEEKIDIASINVKVLNEGAAAGSAGRIKEFLVSKGYVKTEAGNGSEKNISGSAVFYSEKKFKREADWIVEILAGKNIEAEAKEASSAEEKSGDVVVILGK